MNWRSGNLADLDTISGFDWSLAAVILGLLILRMVTIASKRAKQKKAARAAQLDQRRLHLRRM
jgi:hypothetical protein